jgi:sporulation protein YlmC with PRC-barrel domain
MPSEIAQGNLDQFTSRTRSSGIHGIAVSPVNEQLGFLWVKHEALIDVLIPWSCVVAVSQPILICPSRVPCRRSISAETPGPRFSKDC